MSIMIIFSSYSKLPFMTTSLVRSKDSCKILNISAYRKYAGFSTSQPLKYLPTQTVCHSILLNYRYMAGHAKWQNIKHVKAEKDKQKSTLYNKYIRMINAAVREKGPDPKANNKLANLLEESKKLNIPSATLERALKKASSKKLQTGTIEILGPGGFFVVLEYESDNVGDMRHQLKFICRKYSAGIFPAVGGKWRAAYEQKGIIRVTGHINGKSLESEKMLDAAIEAGAEDVQKSDEEDSNVYEFCCAPDDIMEVKKELEKTYLIEEAYVSYLPISTVSLNEADKTIAMNFLNEVGDLPDISRIYENIE